MKTKNKIFTEVFPWIGWLILAILAIILIFSAILYKQSATKGHIQYFSGYQIKWGVFSNNFELSKDNQILEKFKLPVRPLAAWYRPSTHTLAVITSEFANGQVTDNHLLYLWKNNTLRKLYHSVVGYDTEHKQWINSSLYHPIATKLEQTNSVYLTPNEEFLIAREYGYGYSPRIFRTDVNGLVSGLRWTFEAQDMHWSPSGRCLINLGNDSQNGWGYFQKPDDFIYYYAYSIDVENIRNLQIWWKNESPCEGYVTMLADHFGGEGDISVTDQIFNYAIGENFSAGNQIGIKRIDSLPKDINSFSKSIVDDWQMVMITTP